jgi:galactose-1-phosphate uridylyltransferase
MDKEIEKKLEELKKGESLVIVEPKGNGYFVGIGEKSVFNFWAISQKELNKLADLTDKYRDDL